MDKRLKDIQQGTLTESRLNSDFLFWLKEQGPNYLLAALLVLCAILGWNWWEQRGKASRDAAWVEYTEANTPQMLVEVASKHANLDAIAILANLDAADRYLEAVRSGKRVDREAGAPDAAVTPELRAQYLDEADRLFAKAGETAAARPGTGMLVASAWFGRAAVAESKGDLKAAESHLKSAQAAVKDVNPPLARTADERIATLGTLASRPNMPSRPQATLPVKVAPGDASQAPTGDVTASELNALTGGAPAAEAPAPTPAPQPK
jgi:hypothetical protein